MKKLFLAAMVSIALVGCKDKGNDFVGEWKNNDKISETITVTKVDGGYRAVAKLGNPDMAFMDMDVKLVAESDKHLVTADKQAKALELAGDGSVTSYLRNKPKSFTKVN